MAGQNTVKAQFTVCLGDIVLADEGGDNTDGEDLHDGGGNAASPVESSESEDEAEDDVGNIDSQNQIR
jgi:hypothetical protein